MFRFLSKDRTVAKPGFNRWLVPPAALAIHLSIGMAYGFSVFWKPLEQAVGVTAPVPCPKMGLLGQIFSTQYDWSEKLLVVTFTLFFVFLGSSAAIFGGWLERNGPRKAGVAAAICWGGGFFVSALGIYHHQIWLLWLGSGVIGGCGLGLGYISPVSTLIKWFPDKRGMATGLAIMGFGGGAMIGSPLADMLIKHYATATSVGVWQAFVTLGCVYLVVMLCGAFGYRIPAPGWKPHGWNEPAEDTSRVFITKGHVHVKNAHKAPQFWLLWAVLCLNVSAGIGVIAVASPMLQDVFGGKLIGVNGAFDSLDVAQKAALASIAAGFTGLLSLFNSGGRIFWASLSDHIGRKRTYYIFFVLGLFLYVATSFAAAGHNVTLFVGMFCVILTMYGGGFSTIPAYLADLFGTQYVGAIHGRLLTAWSTAGILGPQLVTQVTAYQTAHGVPKQAAYNVTLYVLAGLLLLGFISNLLVRPLDKKHFMSEDELEEEWQLAKVGKSKVEAKPRETKSIEPGAKSWVAVATCWALVGVPLAWGVLKTVAKASALFQ